MSHTIGAPIRAFSTSPVSAAKKLYQLKQLQEAKKILKAAQAAETEGTASDPNNMQDFLEEVRIPQESDRVLGRIEAKIHELQRRIAKVVDQIPKAPTAQPPKHVSDALDASNNTVTTRRGEWRKRKQAQRIEEETFAANRTDQLNELGKLLTEYKTQVAAVKEQAQKQGELRERKEEALAKKRVLLKQLNEYEEIERRAKMIGRTTEKEKGKDAYDLGDILDDALRRVGKIKKEPRPSAKEVRQKDVPASTKVMRQAGLGAVSVLDLDRSERSSDGEALADPIMDEGQVAMAPVQKQETLGIPSKRLGLNVPPSGFIPIDEDLVVSFHAPVPQLQQQLFALRDRLKSSYPRIDTLPYDVWTSNNERTLQTWLKILVSRWQARFDDVDYTGQLEKGVVDEKLKAVLDQMVKDHDLTNDVAERMAMRWHEVFEKRYALDGDAEGKLDWEEMEAQGMGFLADEAGSEPLQHRKPEAIRGESIGSTMPGFGSRRMYSTSSRRTSLFSPSSESKACSIDKADEKDKPHQPQPQPSQPPSSSKPQPANPQPHLPHLTSSGSAHMVSVSDKQHTTRTAIAVGTVYFTNPTPLQLIRSNSLKKGDVLGTSRIAGIMAAKKCPEIIPLCHPIALTHVGVELRAFGHKHVDPSPKSLPSTPASQYSIDPGYGGIQIEAKVQCTGPTGVEMEALTAVMGAALSVVDMCKAVDKFQRVQDVRVVLKEGGKSGVWREEGWGSWQD
jgi:molybdenum cofactor biosynthesis enzyme